MKKRASSDELSNLSKYISLLMSAGVSIDRTLDIVSGQTAEKKLRKSLKNIKRDIERGNLIYKSWQKESGVFPQFFIKMIEIGEKSGNMENVFEELSEYYSGRRKNEKEIAAAMTYPIILASAAVLVFIVIMVYVMPNFIELFEKMDAELPEISRISISAAQFIGTNIFRISIFTFILILISLRVFSIPKVRMKFSSLILRLPAVGKAVENINTAHICKVLSMLFSSGIGMSESLEMAEKCVSSPLYRKSLRDLNHRIKTGKGLFSSVKNIDCFPDMMKTVILVGEETGTLEESLFLLSNFLEEELSNSLKKLVSLIEPVMIILISLLVFFVVITVFLPMMNMYSAAGL